MRRLAAVLLTSTLALAGAATVTPAHAAADIPPRPTPRVQVEAAPGGLPTRATVDDPGADADGGGADLRRLAELRRISYRTPATADGTLTIRSTWKQLRNGNRPGRIQQRLITFIDDANDPDAGFVSIVDGRRGSFTLFEYDDDVDDFVRIRPERVDLTHTYGARGQISVTVSTEWLDVRRVGLTSFSSVGLERTATDITDSARLRVGPRR